MKLEMPDLPQVDPPDNSQSDIQNSSATGSGDEPSSPQFPPALGRRFSLSTLRNLPAKWNNRTALKIIAVVAVLGLLSTFANQRINSDHPIITVDSPDENSEISSSKVFIKGRVEPANSKILISETSEVFRNGDGTFTALVNLKEGENVLNIEAKNFSKKSSVIRLVKRVLSDEEIAKKEEEEAKLSTEKQKSDQLSSLSRGFGSVASANSSDGTSRVVLANVQLLTDLSPTRIVGEVVNQLQVPITNVKVSVLFVNNQGNPIDLSSDFVPINGTMAPGQKLPFEVRTLKRQGEFTNYSFEVTWE